jgi:hypothetical protein
MTLRLLCLLLLSAVSCGAWAEASVADPDPRWLALMHYTSAGWPATAHSHAVSPLFFASERGREDPNAELAANLAAFESELADGLNDQDWRVCRFPARFRYLAQRFPTRLDEAALEGCKDYQAYRRFAAVTGITFIYIEPRGFSARSGFAHVALRLDRGPLDDDRRLLDLTAHNYAPAGGIADLWPTASVYSLESYTKTYLNYIGDAGRSIFEYALDFSPEQVQAIADHIYELQDLTLGYNYLSENCTAELLRTLQVSGHPSLQSLFAMQTRNVPSALVRALHSRGLIRAQRFRSSDPAGTIPEREAQLTSSQQGLAMAIAVDVSEASQLEDYSETQQAAVLDLAIDYYRYRETRANRMIGRVMPPKYGYLLELRRRLPPGEPLEIRPEFFPEQLHNPSRLSLSARATSTGSRYSLEYGGAGHSITDHGRGQPLSTANDLIGFALGIDEQRRLQLDSVLLLRSYFLPTPIAGTWDWGRYRYFGADRNASDGLTAVAEYQFGRALQLDVGERALVFALAGGSARAGGSLDDAYQLAAAFDVGLRIIASDTLQINFALAYRDGVLGDSGAYSHAALSATQTLGSDFALRLEARRADTADAAPENTLQLSITRYF